MNHNKNGEIAASLSIILAVPQVVSAKGLTDFLDAGMTIVNGVLIPLAFSLCLFYFVWGVAKYIHKGASSDKAAEEGRRIMTWGVVGLFVVFSIWGIVNLIRSEIGLPSIENVKIEGK